MSDDDDESTDNNEIECIEIDSIKKLPIQKKII